MVLRQRLLQKVVDQDRLVVSPHALRVQDAILEEIVRIDLYVPIVAVHDAIHFAEQSADPGGPRRKFGRHGNEYGVCGNGVLEDLSLVKVHINGATESTVR